MILAQIHSCECCAFEQNYQSALQVLEKKIDLYYNFCKG